MKDNGEIVEKITNYLRSERRFVFKNTIMKNLIPLGLKKTNINICLRELRKEKIVGFYRRRWGLR